MRAGRQPATTINKEEEVAESALTYSSLGLAGTMGSAVVIGLMAWDQFNRGHFEAGIFEGLLTGADVAFGAFNLGLMLRGHARLQAATTARLLRDSIR